MSSKLRIISKGGNRERRRDKRKLKPTLVISIDDATYVTSDWSLGGLLLTDYYGQREQGEEIEAELRVVTEPDKHAFRASVVRQSTSEGRLALSFTDLSDGAFALLEDLLIGRKRRAAGLCRRPQAPSRKS